VEELGGGDVPVASAFYSPLSFLTSTVLALVPIRQRMVGVQIGP
jgi:hypothetical protein